MFGPAGRCFPKKLAHKFLFVATSKKSEPKKMLGEEPLAVTKCCSEILECSYRGHVHTHTAGICSLDAANTFVCWMYKVYVPRVIVL